MKIQWKASELELECADDRPHPAAGSKAYPDKATRLRHYPIPDTNIGIGCATVGDDVVECWATVDGPEELDPQDGCSFIRTVYAEPKHDVADALQKMARLVKEVAAWARRNDPGLE